MDRVVIEGGIARHERIEVLGETALELIAPHLMRYERTTPPILPRGTIWHSIDRNTNSGALLIEQGPRLHTVSVLHMSGAYEEDQARADADGYSRFEIMLPWQYFAFSVRFQTNGERTHSFIIDGQFLFWRPRQLTEAESDLWPAAVPNVDSVGGICWGGTTAGVNNNSLAERINEMVANFYNTNFNEDLGHRTPFGHSLTQWETDSRNPLSFVTWDYWNNPEITRVPLSGLPERLNVPPTPIWESNRAYVTIPEIPANFTVGRAREMLLNDLTEGQRRRLIAAVQTLEEAPLADGEAVTA